MANTPTLSLRIADEHHRLLRDIAAGLKADPAIAAALRAVLPVQAGVPPVAGSPLADIVARVVALERWRAGAATGALPAPVGASQAEPETGQASPAVPADPWTSGEGRQKRLTPAGLAELDRRLSAGESVPAIAEALGVSHQTVSKRRAALE